MTCMKLRYTYLDIDMRIVYDTEINVVRYDSPIIHTTIYWFDQKTLILTSSVDRVDVRDSERLIGERSRIAFGSFADLLT